MSASSVCREVEVPDASGIADDNLAERPHLDQGKLIDSVRRKHKVSHSIMKDTAGNNEEVETSDQQLGTGLQNTNLRNSARGGLRTTLGAWQSTKAAKDDAVHDFDPVDQGQITKSKAIVYTANTVLPKNEEFRQHRKRLQDCCRELATKESDWTSRTIAMDNLRSYFGGEKDKCIPREMLRSRNMADVLMDLASNLTIQLTELRSSVVKDACHTIQTMARYMGHDFVLLGDIILPQLLTQTVVTIKVISSSCDECIKCILENAKINIIHVILDGAQGNKSGVYRARCFEYIIIIIKCWPKEAFDGKKLDLILKTLIKGTGDAGEEGRRWARSGLIAVFDRWPEKLSEIFCTLDRGVIGVLCKEHSSSGLAKALHAKCQSEGADRNRRSTLSELRAEYQKELKGKELETDGKDDIQQSSKVQRYSPSEGDSHIRLSPEKSLSGCSKLEIGDIDKDTHLQPRMSKLLQWKLQKDGVHNQTTEEEIANTKSLKTVSLAPTQLTTVASSGSLDGDDNVDHERTQQNKKRHQLQQRHIHMLSPTFKTLLPAFAANQQGRISPSGQMRKKADEMKERREETDGQDMAYSDRQQLVASLRHYGKIKEEIVDKMLIPWAGRERSLLQYVQSKLEHLENENEKQIGTQVFHSPEMVAKADAFLAEIYQPFSSDGQKKSDAPIELGSLRPPSTPIPDSNVSLPPNTPVNELCENLDSFHVSTPLPKGVPKATGKIEPGSEKSDIAQAFSMTKTMKSSSGRTYPGYPEELFQVSKERNEAQTQIRRRVRKAYGQAVTDERKSVTVSKSNANGGLAAIMLSSLAKWACVTALIMILLTVYRGSDTAEHLYAADDFALKSFIKESAVHLAQAQVAEEIAEIREFFGEAKRLKQDAVNVQESNLQFAETFKHQIAEWKTEFANALELLRNEHNSSLQASKTESDHVIDTAKETIERLQDELSTALDLLHGKENETWRFTEMKEQNERLKRQLQEMEKDLREKEQLLEQQLELAKLETQKLRNSLLEARTDLRSLQTEKSMEIVRLQFKISELENPMEIASAFGIDVLHLDGNISSKADAPKMQKEELSNEELERTISLSWTFVLLCVACVVSLSFPIVYKIQRTRRIWSLHADIPTVSDREALTEQSAASPNGAILRRGWSPIPSRFASPIVISPPNFNLMSPSSAESTRYSHMKSDEHFGSYLTAVQMENSPALMGPVRRSFRLSQSKDPRTPRQQN